MVAGGHAIYQHPNLKVCHCCGSRNNINHCMYECGASTTRNNVIRSLNTQIGNKERYTAIEQIIKVPLIMNEAKKYIQKLIKNDSWEILNNRTGTIVINKDMQTELVEFEVSDQQPDGMFNIIPLEHGEDNSRTYRNQEAPMPIDLAARVKDD